MKCYDCGVEVKHWAKGDKPMVRHAALSPTCAFVKANFKSDVSEVEAYKEKLKKAELLEKDIGGQRKHLTSTGSSGSESEVNFGELNIFTLPLFIALSTDVQKVIFSVSASCVRISNSGLLPSNETDINSWILN